MRLSPPVASRNRRDIAGPRYLAELDSDRLHAGRGLRIINIVAFVGHLTSLEAAHEQIGSLSEALRGERRVVKLQRESAPQLCQEEIPLCFAQAAWSALRLIHSPRSFWRSC